MSITIYWCDFSRPPKLLDDHHIIVAFESSSLAEGLTLTLEAMSQNTEWKQIRVVDANKNIIGSIRRQNGDYTDPDGLDPPPNPWDDPPLGPKVIVVPSHLLSEAEIIFSKNTLFERSTEVYRLGDLTAKQGKHIHFIWTQY